MTDGVTVLGIRHHGPGSSRSVLGALNRLMPDLILVEGPPDGQALIRFVANPGMQPPVALVVYRRDRPGTGVFYPMAAFSPEWNAMRFALSHEIPVRFCDLPMAVALASTDERQTAESPDAIQLLSQAAGELDPERWWERMVEQRGDDTDVFKAVLEAIASVREGVPPSPPHEARREAYMRSVIRQARTEGCSNIAVICGAWHAPALDVLPPRKNDDALLRGLKRTRVDATWVPWTASRLAYTSGYGAGVESPAWYRHLWETGGDVTAWLASAARLLRGEDLDASPANVVDAVRLAETLSSIRGRPRPSLSEVTDATLSVLCAGESAPMRLIQRRLIVGEEMGSVPPGVPVLPLQRDIEDQARGLRVRMAPEERVLDLDLRQAHGLAQSRFFHRLNLLGIDWARLQPVPAGRLGTFHEVWSLRWRPEMVLQIIEAGVYGNTLAEAASARAIERGDALVDLARTADLVQTVLLADLEPAISRLVGLLANRSAESVDVLQMLDALPALVATVRYGDVRRTDAATLSGVVSALAERAAVGVVPASLGLDDDAADQLGASILAATQSLGLLVDDALRGVIGDWWVGLRQIVDRPEAAPVIRGICTRLALNAERLGMPEAEDRLVRALARGTPPAEAARWLEGFLSPNLGGSGLMLASSTRLFGLVDTWLTSLPDEYFAQVLPLLRRTTSGFSAGERRQIAERVRRGQHLTLPVEADQLDLARAALVEPVLRQILGLEP